MDALEQSKAHLIGQEPVEEKVKIMCGQASVNVVVEVKILMLERIYMTNEQLWFVYACIQGEFTQFEITCM